MPLLEAARKAQIDEVNTKPPDEMECIDIEDETYMKYLETIYSMDE